MTALKHVYRYLLGTEDYELCYNKCHTKLELMGYSDADWPTMLRTERALQVIVVA